MPGCSPDQAARSAGTTSTGRLAWCTTPAATLPSKADVTGEIPCEPTTISRASCSPASAMSDGHAVVHDRHACLPAGSVHVRGRRRRGARATGTPGSNAGLGTAAARRARPGPVRAQQATRSARSRAAPTPTRRRSTGRVAGGLRHGCSVTAAGAAPIGGAVQIAAADYGSPPALRRPLGVGGKGWTMPPRRALDAHARQRQAGEAAAARRDVTEQTAGYPDEADHPARPVRPGGDGHAHAARGAICRASRRADRAVAADEAVLDPR